jgi:hypothetical protein
MSSVRPEIVKNASGKPVMIRALFWPRRSLGEYSIASGLAAVYSPPTNTPTMKRSAMNRTTDATPHVA